MSNPGVGVPGRVIAKVASVGLDQASNAMLADCFKQFGVQVVPVEGDPVALLNRQKFEACVVRLYDPETVKILDAARKSNSNRRMVIYGVARNTQEALQHSAYGINAVLDEPIDRQSVLKVVRATYLLVVHELRRYVRIPVVADTAVEAGGSRKMAAMAVEVSGGGMSLRCETSLASFDSVRVSFVLPGSKRISVRALVCWSRVNEHLYGLRFDPTDDARLDVRKWIDQYLEIM
ncbi:MAG: PilZ domain-containing protein [Acidobacteriia bacterium]|nr:PilZ domain-containing protein [Terriglobia bacterium]